MRVGFEPTTHSLEGCCSIQLSYPTIPKNLIHESYFRLHNSLLCANSMPTIYSPHALYDFPLGLSSICVLRNQLFHNPCISKRTNHPILSDFIPLFTFVNHNIVIFAWVFTWVIITMNERHIWVNLLSVMNTMYKYHQAN